MFSLNIEPIPELKRQAYLIHQLISIITFNKSEKICFKDCLIYLSYRCLVMHGSILSSRVTLFIQIYSTLNNFRPITLQSSGHVMTYIQDLGNRKIILVAEKITCPLFL